MKLSLVVPVYNEVFLVRTVWEKLKTAPIAACKGITAVEIVVVDDGSTDGTPGVLAEITAAPFVFTSGLVAEVHYHPLPKNKGKGHAVRFGMSRTTGDIVLIQDADLEYSPDDYPQLMAPIVAGDADAVFGSRFIGTPRRAMYFWHSFINKFLTILCNMLNDVNLTDMETCYKAMRGNLARSLRLTSNRFGIEPELTSRLARSRARIYEVPVSYRGRTYEEGKKIGAKDGVAALWHIVKFAFLDREPFQPGLMQTLTALDKVASVVYAPLLQRAVQAVALGRSFKILEIGAGIGSLTRILKRYGVVMATDISDDYVRAMRSRFESDGHVKVARWDATRPPLGEMGTYDLIVSFNVLEHIDDDQSALATWRSLLEPGGTMVVLVPNGPRLFSPIDEALGHYRRYTAAELEAKIAKVGLRPVKTFFGNALGIVGWFVNGVLLRRTELPTGQLRLYAMLRGAFGWLERIVERSTGLSVIVVARN